MGMLSTALADADKGHRMKAWAQAAVSHVGASLRALSVRKWSEQTIIALVMQSRDNSITCFLKRGLFGSSLTSRQGIGEPNPVWIPAAHEVVRRIAKRIRGTPFGS